jgi:hypothetical protein
MANWYGYARSNKFNVEDVDAFKNDLLEASIEIVDNEDGSVTLFSDEENGGWPTTYYDEESEEYEFVELDRVIQLHIQEGDCAILMEVGAEKLRYLTGTAMAITSKEIQVIDLLQIYDVAEKMVGNTVNLAEY